MALESMHPHYANFIADWRMVRDFAKGERAVKAKTTEYLPATKGMLLDGMGSTANNKSKLGQEVYDAYLLRAVFPEYMRDALEIFMGMLHNKSPVIELPKGMDYLRDAATEIGEPLELLLQRINLEQLTTGRLGLLLDMPKIPDPIRPNPFIALYVAEAIRNWDDGIHESASRAQVNMVILDESGFRRGNEFQWIQHKRFRLLELQPANGDTGPLVYKAGVFANDSNAPMYSADAMFTPAIRGKTLNEIPFVFVNASDITPEPTDPPLVALARMCGAIYRSEADYRQNLFMQGQDTLVIIGSRAQPIQVGEGMPEEPLRTGAGSRIDLDQGGDAKYIGVNSQGLTEQRYALENDRKRGESRSGQLIDASKGQKESGTALRTRVGAQTATLNQIAKTGGLALEMILKKCATWMGLDPNEVKVQPNLEFADYQMAGQDLVNLMTAKRTGGAPISEESIHRLMVQGNLTSFDYNKEKELISAEDEFLTPEAKLALEIAKTKPATPPAGPGPEAPRGSVSTNGPAPKDPGNPA